jgi:hypothetical protein
MTNQIKYGHLDFPKRPLTLTASGVPQEREKRTRFFALLSPLID